MCRSEICKMRSGAEPGCSTGTSNGRTVKALRSTSTPYASVAAPRPATPAAVRSVRDMPTSLRANGDTRLEAPGDCEPRYREAMPDLKARLQSDLNQAMKSRDQLRTATLRMTLAAITTEEVAGAQARELSDDEVQRVITRETRKRREAAEAFDQAGRAELADRERAEGALLEDYLPKLLDDAELAEVVRAAVIEAGATEPRQLGAVMKLVQPRVVGRADGRRVSNEVRRQLSS